MIITDHDIRLLEFSTYKKYLKSLVTTQDLRYLGHRQNGLNLYLTGFRSITESDFENRRKEVIDFLYASPDPNAFFTRNIQTSEPLLSELAARERPNRLGLLSTIIYIRCQGKHGEISGYIDYEQALLRANKNKKNTFDWKAIFTGKQKLYPTRRDLSYYNFTTDKAFKRNSKNYLVMFDPIRGIIFRNICDRKDVYPDPIGGYFGENTTRKEIDTDNYEQVILYDHVVSANY